MKLRVVISLCFSGVVIAAVAYWLAFVGTLLVLHAHDWEWTPYYLIASAYFVLAIVLSQKSLLLMERVRDRDVEQSDDEATPTDEPE